MFPDTLAELAGFIAIEKGGRLLLLNAMLTAWEQKAALARFQELPPEGKLYAFLQRAELPPRPHVLRGGDGDLSASAPSPKGGSDV